MITSHVKSFALIVATVATTEAHNKMTLPEPTWPTGFYAQNSPSGTIDPANALPVPSGMSYTTDSTSNTNAYWTAFNSSKYTSLKELVWAAQTLEDSASRECGFSLSDGMARDLPDLVQWDFFTASHQGPCEVWCDDTLVFENWNCAINYPDTPANLPYDKAKCQGASVLTSYWIALHTTPWQVYTNCAPLVGTSSASDSNARVHAFNGTEMNQSTTEPSNATESNTSKTSLVQVETNPPIEGASTKAAKSTVPSTGKCTARLRRH